MTREAAVNSIHLVWLIIAAIDGFLAVAAGAFAVHALHGEIPSRAVEVFQTGAQYQMYHALALLAVAWVAGTAKSKAASVAGWSFVIGTLLFSGSHYALALSGIEWLGAVTPFGGVAFLVGWASLACAGLGARGQRNS